MAIKPHSFFRTITPDEVAETMDGVPTELYQKLWSFVEDYPCKMTPEEREEPTPGSNNLAGFWDRLTPEEQTKLNELATKADAEFERQMERFQCKS